MLGQIKLVEGPGRQKKKRLLTSTDVTDTIHRTNVDQWNGNKAMRQTIQVRNIMTLGLPLVM